MITKAQVMQALAELPEDASPEEIKDCIDFVMGVERALEEIDEGETISHDEALQRISQWRK